MIKIHSGNIKITYDKEQKISQRDSLNTLNSLKRWSQPSQQSKRDSLNILNSLKRWSQPSQQSKREFLNNLKENSQKSKKEF